MLNKFKDIKNVHLVGATTMVFKENFKPFLSNLLETAINEALKDGIITSEESVILSRIEVDVRSFEKELAKSISSKVSLDDENAKKLFKEQLIKSIKQLAMEDGQLSKDEEAIITKLEQYFAKK